MYIYMYIYIYIYIHTYIYMVPFTFAYYEAASINRMLKKIGLFAKYRSLL